MLLGLDHLVVAVRDPDAAAAELERAVGLRSTGGGRHPSWGTYNRLAWLGDTYIELIGVFDASLAPSGAVSRVVERALRTGREGLVAYAVASDDLAGDLERLRADGSQLSDVEVRSRTRPDGEVVRWQASFPPELGVDQPPFVIEHELLGAEWGDAARAQRADLAHPVGGPARVVGLELFVADVAHAAAAYRHTVGIEFENVDPRGATASLGSQVVRLHHGAPSWNPAVVDIAVVGARSESLEEAEALGIRWRLRT